MPHPEQSDSNRRTIDTKILRALADGRSTPSHLAETINARQPYVSRRLSVLIEDGDVEKVHRGLYELANGGPTDE